MEYHCASMIIFFVSSVSIIITQEVSGVPLDLTLVPDSHGADVVRAVISKISFSNISFNLGSNTRDAIARFMRTMAYVETKDGAQLNNSNGGGIWNVSNSRFDHAKDQFSNQTVMMQLLDRSQFNHIGPVNWSSITYDNLTIPLYSGLVVRILIHLQPSARLDDYCHYWNFGFKSRVGDTDQCNKNVQRLANIESM